MANFRYTAKGMDGKVRRALMEAANETALQQQLKEQGLYLIRAKEAGRAGKRRKLSSRQLSELAKSLSTLLASGVSIVRALEIIAEEEGLSPAARTLYLELLADLRKGLALSEAMELRGCFPELMLGMIRSGEGSGNLDQVMNRLALHYERESRLKQQVRSTMTYPAVLLVMCVLVVIVIVTFILPQFEELFAEMETLPAITELLMAASRYLVSEWYVLLFVLFLLGVLLRIVSKIDRVRYAIDLAKVRLPVIGRLNRVIYTARFARTLSSLYSSGMPVAAALGTAGGTVGNLYVERQFDKVIAMVRSGIPLSASLREVDGFLKKLSSTIMVGEESGRLDTMLDSIAVTMEEEAEEATKRLVTLLEPVLILIMALLVGFIIVAVMLPIYQSYGAIEGAA
ncbi:type II secretion system F family protein [uncultured Oscillibacter sp.]|uniref:type II secretion system F family protein n=1 Tax=uncultured Oscillibacter sp. TaxID=876091 RepID=UPI00272BAAA0|nr:type II secretion system F family protein [uncultured Oscillibacter sp.]